MQTGAVLLFWYPIFAEIRCKTFIMQERLGGRAADELRPIHYQRDYVRHAEGSVLCEHGDTRVLCTASWEESVPRWRRGRGSGWVKAEYGMLPRATGTRARREATSGQQGGRTLEIQRLIGRSLRACVDLNALGENTLILDCDVLQADGGTRTAAINGAFLAMQDAVDRLLATGALNTQPIHGQIAAISAGIVGGELLLDLDYAEDSAAEADVNVVMNDAGAFVEVQGTAEGHAFRRDELDRLLDMAAAGIQDIMKLQLATRENSQ